MTRRAITRIGAACAAIAVVTVCGTALAYFSSGGTGTAAAAVTQLTTPTITAANAATGGTVALTWQGVAAPGGGTVTYYVTRNGGEPGGNCPSLKGQGTATTCTDSGLSPGTYEYRVTALFQTWSKTSAVASATVTVGPVAKFAIAGTPTSATAGVAINLTITAQDEAGGKVTTFTGLHGLTFAGAETSPSGTNPPTVANSSGTAIPFGTSTPLTFTSGVATISSTKNGVMKIFKVGGASVTATEGSLTTPVPLNVTITSAAASKFTLKAASATPTAGTGDALTINAFDPYGNPATTYTGSHNVVFSGASAIGTNTPTVDNSSGSPIAFGSSTAIVFNAGVATVSEGANGEMILYKSGSTTIKVAEGSTVTTTTGVTVAVAPATTAALSTTASLATEPTTTGFTLTITAKDSYGNITPAYTGEKKLTFTGTGTATETSPSGSVAAVVNNAGAAIPLGSETAITFAGTGIATSASSKNGYLRLYKPGTAALSVSDGTVGGTLPALTVTIGAAKRVAFSGLTVSSGTIGSPCFFTCAITLLGNSGTVSANLMITDEYGNTISNIGASKTVAVAAIGTTGSTVTGSPLALPETGPAVTSEKFTYTAPASGAYGNTLTASSTGYTSATATTSK